MIQLSRRIVLLGAAATACAPMRRTDRNSLVVGLTYDIDTLNVYSTGFLGDVQAAVVEGLMAPDGHARYVPVLATEVPTVENGDGVSKASKNDDRKLRRTAR